SAQEARWLAIAARGLGRSRPAGPIARRHLRKLAGTLDVLQLDAIHVVARTQFLVPFSRLGAYDTQPLLRMAAAGGELFECWGHAASWLPIDSHPLHRWRMSEHRFGEASPAASRHRAWQETNAVYIAAVLDEVRDRGPLTAADLSDPRRRAGEWW